MVQPDFDQKMMESVIDFGGTFSESRQYQHFEESREDLNTLPHLQRQHYTRTHGEQSDNESSMSEASDKDMPDIIDSVPTIKEPSKPVARPRQQTVRFDPDDNNTKTSNNNQIIDIKFDPQPYSGPKLNLDKAALKSCVEFRKHFFKPENYANDKVSRYFMPNILDYLQAAFDEGSYYPNKEAALKKAKGITSRPLPSQPKRTLPHLQDDDTESDELESDKQDDDDDYMEDVDMDVETSDLAARKQSLGKRSATPTNPHGSTSSKKKFKYQAKPRHLSHDVYTDDSDEYDEYGLPNKNTSIKKLFNLANFLLDLQLEESLSYECVICFNTSLSEVVCCNNPFCEVKVHTECYWEENLNSSTWKCQRCKHFEQDKGGSYLGHHCALCPNTTGLFCKLDSNDVDIPWAHLACAAVFLERSDFSDDFLANFEEIEDQNYELVCSQCEATTDAIPFGAKMATNSGFSHATCIQRKLILGENESKDEQLTILAQYDNYLNWIMERDNYIKTHFKKDASMFTIDIWKKLAKKLTSPIEMGSYKLNEHYKQYFTAIKQQTYELENTFYNSWLDYSFNLLATKFTRRQLEKTVGLKMSWFTERLEYDYQYLGSRKATTPIKQEKIKKPLSNDNVNTNSKGTVKATNNENPDTGKNKKGRKATAKKTANRKKPQPVMIKKPKAPPPRKIDLLEKKAQKPSDDLKCSICNLHELPEETKERLGCDSKYFDHLKETQHLRKPGFTGKTDYWDPAVFIKCGDCSEVVHCGCPSDPIKDYPSKHEEYLCQKCDPHDNEVKDFKANIVKTKRPKKPVNYRD